MTNAPEAGYDRDHVQEYIRLFPDSPLASMWKGYFAYVEVPLWDGDDNEAPALSLLDDPVDIVMVRLSLFVLISLNTEEPRVRIWIYLIAYWEIGSLQNFI